MKIISYGNIKPITIICAQCRAKLEYTPMDIKKHSNKFHTYEYVVCPVCGKWRFLKSEAH